MAKAKGKAQAAQVADNGKARKVVNRKKRNALERKALPSSLQVIFKDNTRAQNRALLAAWQDSRKKVKEER